MKLRSGTTYPQEEVNFRDMSIARWRLLDPLHHPRQAIFNDPEHNIYNLRINYKMPAWYHQQLMKLYDNYGLKVCMLREIKKLGDEYIPYCDYPMSDQAFSGLYHNGALTETVTDYRRNR